jgi:hypothetical protein
MVLGTTMAKRRGKKRRNASKQSQRITGELNRLCLEPVARLLDSEPPILGEPDVPVYSPLKPRPNLRSGAIALPEPEPEENP